MTTGQHPTPEDSAGENTASTGALPVPPTVHDADPTDQPPPVNVPGKGPMDQSVPDVTVGSTPATRHDD